MRARPAAAWRRAVARGRGRAGAFGLAFGLGRLGRTPTCPGGQGGPGASGDAATWPWVAGRRLRRHAAPPCGAAGTSFLGAQFLFYGCARRSPL